jgi:hypothetical protein
MQVVCGQSFSTCTAWLACSQSEGFASSHTVLTNGTSVVLLCLRDIRCVHTQQYCFRVQATTDIALLLLAATADVHQQHTG